MSPLFWRLLVGISTGAGFLFSENRWEILVLGVTAAMIGWYTEETKRAADETQNMAESNRMLAEDNRQLMEHQRSMQEVNLALEHVGGSRAVSDLDLTNQGPGKAMGVKIEFENPEEPLRWRDWPLIEPNDTVELQGVKARRVIVTTRDTLERPYRYVWECDADRQGWELIEGRMMNAKGEK